MTDRDDDPAVTAAEFLMVHASISSAHQKTTHISDMTFLKKVAKDGQPSYKSSS